VVRHQDGVGHLFVFGQPPLHAGAREHADERPVLDDGDALVVVLLEEREGVLEGHLRVERRVRRLGERAERRRVRVEPARDHLAHERLPRDHAGELAVVRDEDRAHVRVLQRLPRLARRAVRLERERVAHHRVADELRHG
jgi:hypothetical protein